MKDIFNEKTFRNTLLPLVLLSVSAGANALTLSVDSAAYAPTTSTGDQQSSVNNTGTGYASAYSSDYDSLNNESYASSRGFVNASGVMGVGNYGDGTSYSSQSELSWSDSYTNTSATAEDISFDFLIWGGSLNTWGADTTGESAESSYWIDILVNGASLWSSSASLTSATTGTSLNETGTSLGGTLSTYSDGGYYSWADSTTTLDLGTLGAGETLTLEYIMGGSASGVGTLDTSTNCYWEYEGELLLEGQFIEEEGYLCGGVSSNMSIGDPFGFSSAPSLSPTISGTAVASVPEPETFLLLGAGVFAMSLVSRRRKANRES